MAVAPKVKFIDPGTLNEILAAKPTLTDEVDVEKWIELAIYEAASMLRKGEKRIEAVFHHRFLKNKKSAWKNDSVIVRFFGDDHVTRGQMMLTRKRIRRADRRVNKRLYIRLRSQSKASSANTLGRNTGGILTPRTFQLYPKWFELDQRRAAGTIIHELFHDWHGDHEVNGETAYTLAAVEQLARENPRAARQNPENYERFCLEL